MSSFGKAIARFRRMGRYAREWYRMSRVHGPPSWLLYLEVILALIVAGLIIFAVPLLHGGDLPHYTPR